MTLEELAQAAKDRRAVTGFRSASRLPAAFVLNMPGGLLVNILPKLKLYEKKEKSDGAE